MNIQYIANFQNNLDFYLKMFTEFLKKYSEYTENSVFNNNANKVYKPALK